MDIHVSVDYYSAFKKKSCHLVQHRTNLRTLRSERSQSQEDKHCVIPSVCGTYSCQLTEAESRTVAAQGWEVRKMGTGFRLSR